MVPASPSTPHSQHPPDGYTQQISPTPSTSSADVAQGLVAEDGKLNLPEPLLQQNKASILPDMPGVLQSPQQLQTEVKPMVSQNAMLVVLNYSPTEGEAGVPIAVDIDLCTTMQSGDGKMPPMKLRLVIGRTALPTIVRDLSPPANIEGNNDGPEQPHGRSVFRLRVTANAPDYFGARFPEQQSVPLTLQAIGPVSPNDVIDQVIFGSFTYWGPSTSICPDLILPTDGAVAAVVKGSPTQMSGVKRPREQDDYREASRPIPPPPVPTTANPTALSLTRPEVELSLMRTTSVPRNQTGVVEAKLEWVVTDDCPHPKDMEQQNTWTSREHSAGRRLVRFRRWQVGGVLQVACEAIPQENFDEADIVISCIYRKENRSCYFTSVDVIYLLERLVGEAFSVEEKNRIRRNLEGFKPVTIAKHRAGCDRFFQRIMDFPPPKPRNIEKDVKVFSWDVLPSALDKIISKYSLIAIETPKSASNGSDTQGLSNNAMVSKRPIFAANSGSPMHAHEDHYAQPMPMLAPALDNDDNSSQESQLMYPPSPTQDQLWQRRGSVASISTELQSPEFAAQQPQASHNALQDGYLNGYLHMPGNLSLSELSMVNSRQGLQGGHYELNRSFGHITPMPSMVATSIAMPPEEFTIDYNGRRNSIADSGNAGTTLGNTVFAPSFIGTDVGLSQFDGDLYGPDVNFFLNELVYPATSTA